MTKTGKKVITSYRENGCPVFRCVYTDESGKFYVKKDGCFKCINGTPCMESMR